MTIERHVLVSLAQEFRPLVGLRLDWLSVPGAALPGFEPSQVAVIVNTLADAALPQIHLFGKDPENAAKLASIGLAKSPGTIGQREGYPDYIHKSGFRVELKGLFVDNVSLDLKRPPTVREPSARLKENVRLEHLQPEKDVLMLAAIQLQEADALCHPVIVDFDLFPMIECITARDGSLLKRGGRWKGDIPQVIKRGSRPKLAARASLEDADYEKDTNFGKLRRIPYPPLQDFLRKHGVRAGAAP